MPRNVGVTRKIIVSIIHGLLSSFWARVDLQLEVMALRHQLEVGLAGDVRWEPMMFKGDWLHGYSPVWAPTWPQNGESLAFP
jgi:hypothetical protein